MFYFKLINSRLHFSTSQRLYIGFAFRAFVRHYLEDGICHL